MQRKNLTHQMDEKIENLLKTLVRKKINVVDCERESE